MSSLVTIGVVGAVGGAVIASKGQKQAAQTQADAQLQGSDTIYRQFKETEARLLPYSQGGISAFKQQQALSGADGAEAQQTAYDQYVESPGVAWARERGLRGIDQTAAAQGSLISGNRDKARIAFSQGSALQDFNNYWNRLGSVAGTGLAATQAIAGVGSQAAQGQAQLQSNAGTSIAGGQLGAAQSYQSGFSQLGSIAGQAIQGYQNRSGQTGIGGYFNQQGRGW